MKSRDAHTPFVVVLGASKLLFRALALIVSRSVRNATTQFSVTFGCLSTSSYTVQTVKWTGRQEDGQNSPSSLQDALFVPFMFHCLHQRRSLQALPHSIRRFCMILLSAATCKP